MLIRTKAAPRNNLNRPAEARREHLLDVHNFRRTERRCGINGDIDIAEVVVFAARYRPKNKGVEDAYALKGD